MSIEELDLAMKYVQSTDCAVDGGANRGDWTRELAGLFNEVWAFEPHAGAFSNLAQNIKDLSNVRMVEQALGDKVAEVGMHCRRKIEFTDAYVALDGDDTEMVPLDRYKLDNIGLIKLDLEGFEYFALLGAEKSIRTSWPVIIIESIPKFEKRFDLKNRAAVRWLEDLGYEEVGRFPPNRIFVRGAVQ